MPILMQKQLFRHNPEKDEWGDCVRTCIASMLGLSAKRAPHWFYRVSTSDEAQHAWHNMQRWLKDEFGLYLVEFRFEVDLNSVYNYMETINPGVPFILGGTSANGFNHFVIANNHEIIMDPAQNDSGIVGPEAEGYYTICFLAILP